MSREKNKNSNMEQLTLSKYTSFAADNPADYEEPHKLKKLASFEVGLISSGFFFIANQ